MATTGLQVTGRPTSCPTNPGSRCCRTRIWLTPGACLSALRARSGPAIMEPASQRCMPSRTMPPARKGVTLEAAPGGPGLLTANFSEGTVDAYDGDLNLIGQLSDSHAPAGYAPFNVQSIEGMIFVTFAKQDADKKDDIHGPGHGLIDVLNLQTQTFHRFVTGSDAGGRLRAIDSPW